MGRATPEKKPSQTSNKQSTGDHITTFYIANLPWDCALGLLWRTFRNHGMMTDVYLPRRRNKVGKYFAFLRFEHVRNTESMVKALSNVRLGDQKLFVNEAKFKKEEANTSKDLHNIKDTGNITGGEPKSHAKEKRPIREERTWGDAAHFPPLGNNYGRRPIQIPDKVFSTQSALGRLSLIGRVRDVTRLCRLEDFLKATKVKDVTLKYVAGMTAILSFMTSGLAESFLKDKKEEWEQWFYNLEIWNGQTIPFERIAWLKISGVPLQLWDKEVFDTIASSYGELVHGSVASSRDGNYAMEQVAIVVKDGRRISDVVEIQWKRNKFKIWVDETEEIWSPDFVKADLSSGSSTDNDRQVDGYEDGENIGNDVVPVINLEQDDPVNSPMNDGPENDDGSHVPVEDQMIDDLVRNTNGLGEGQGAPFLEVHGDTDVFNATTTSENNTSIMEAPNQEFSGSNHFGGPKEKSAPLTNDGPQLDPDNNFGLLGSSRKRARWDFGPNDDLIDLNSPPSHRSTIPPSLNKSAGVTTHKRKPSFTKRETLPPAPSFIPPVHLFSDIPRPPSFDPANLHAPTHNIPDPTQAIPNQEAVAEVSLTADLGNAVGIRLAGFEDDLVQSITEEGEFSVAQ